MSAAWSDSRLLVVVLIESAVMLVLSIVTAYDIKYKVIRSFSTDTAPPYYEYKSTCFQNINTRSHTTLFILVSAIQGNCLVFLFILLLIFSIITSYIRCSNFKEIKRTNIFTMAFIVMYSLLFTFASGDLKRYIIIIHILDVTASFLCQLVIFPPIFFQFSITPCSKTKMFF